jgi:hypothetical protein
MSSLPEGELHLEGIEKMWCDLRDGGDARKLQQHLLRWVDQSCKEQINAGNYDATVALADLFDRFHQTFITGDRELKSGEELDVTSVFPGTLPNEVASKLLFQRLVDQLVERDVLLYVYDKQRVRSRVAEITRYFALLRQRFDDESDFEESPSLTKMVKMDIQSREKPKWGDEGINLGDNIRETISKIRTAEPAPELAEVANRKEWQDATTDSLEIIYSLCKRLGMTGLAAFQGRALDRLYRQSVTNEYDELGHVVTASTGGGKTEAFLFPILAYALTTSHPDVRLDGVDAILAYPRKDLCNNQFQRIVEYLYKLERVIENGSDIPFDSLPITVALQHSDSRDAEIDCPVDGCDGRMTTENMECEKDAAHTVDFGKTQKGTSADIMVVTPDTLHRRLMDHHGRSQFWRYDTPPKFAVLDEVHVYTSQYGMHVANVMRRFRAALSEVDSNQEPCFVASSATISNAESFTEKMFGVPNAREITPTEDEIEEIGWEYLIFIKATDPREVQVPQGEAKYLPRDEWDEDDFQETNVTNLSSMIQVAFGMYHTVLKKDPDEGPLKNKILGFVDSIDSVKRLADYIHDAETGRGTEGKELFQLRAPDAFLREESEPSTNPDCPKHLFRSNSAEHERAVCEPLPPNKHLNPCPVYEAGECWWTMTDQLDLEPMDVYLHKSGRTETPDGESVNDDNWDLMVTTSALEVGFDHPGIIGTFQYRAPMNIPGFVQRKGRGGREPDDQPVSVVVLGSRPEDAFYFHHENLLSDPDPRYLRINLDEQNEFVRIEHMVSSIFDYLNLTDYETANQVYRRLDIDELDRKLAEEQAQIEDWMRRAFPTADDELISDVLQNVRDYVGRTQAPITPADIGEEITSFWESARIPKGTTQSELKAQLKELEFQRRLFEGMINDEINLDTQTDD